MSPRIGRCLRIRSRWAALAIGAILVQGCASPASSLDRERPPSQAEFVSPSLETKMAAVAAAIEQRGFARAGDPSRSFLVEGDALVEPAVLANGRCQVFVALGTQAIHEISLGVFDSGGTEMASARASAPSVALRYCPDVPGTHYLSVRALHGDGIIAARRFEGPSGIAIDLEDLFLPTNEGAEAP